jgi:hypothetical protein
MTLPALLLQGKAIWHSRVDGKSSIKTQAEHLQRKVNTGGAICGSMPLSLRVCGRAPTKLSVTLPLLNRAGMQEEMAP